MNNDDNAEFTDETLLRRIQELEDLLGEAKEKLEKQDSMLDVLSTTDDLTKLLTQEAVYTLLEEEINRARRYKTSLSILLLEIDHLRRIKDTHGPEHGALVLQKVAEAIKFQIRKVDAAGRFGEHGALILFPNTGSREANIISERLRAAVQQIPFENGLQVTISGGLKSYEGEDVLAFLGTADEMLAQAKENRIARFTPS